MTFVLAWTGGLASVLIADLGACWALVFLAIAGLFPPQRPARDVPQVAEHIGRMILAGAR